MGGALPHQRRLAAILGDDPRAVPFGPPLRSVLEVRSAATLDSLMGVYSSFNIYGTGKLSCIQVINIPKIALKKTAACQAIILRTACTQGVYAENCPDDFPHLIVRKYICLISW